MVDKEHPGPKTPAQEGSSSAETQSSGSGSSSGNAKPAIHQPESAAEKDDPEVKKHNEEMRDRHEVSANQLGEADNKVDPKYWKGQFSMAPSA